MKSNADRAVLTIGGVFKCDSYTKLNIISTYPDKVNWVSDVGGVKENGERTLFVSSIKEDASNNQQNFIFLNDPILTGNVQAFKKRVFRSNTIKTDKTFSGDFYQVVVIPNHLECDEAIRLKIRDRFLSQTEILRLHKGVTKQKSNAFKLNPKEILLFGKNGYEYYFYPPNYISKYKIDKIKKKIFQSTIYLYSIVIDEKFNLRYPTQEIMIQRFDDFFKNISDDNYEIGLDKYITDHCAKC